MSAGSAVPGSSKDCTQSIKSNSSSKNSSKNNSTVPHLVQQQQNNKDPQPGTSNHSSGNCNNSESATSESAKESPYVIVNNAVDLNNQAGQPADDPKPGPSTTAAEFDLEVFDSGSSCSLEDCWRCDKDCPPTVAPVVQATASTSSTSKGLRSKSRSKKHLSSSATSESSENESYDELVGIGVIGSQGSPMNPHEPMESACPSETEEAISDEEDLEENDEKMEDMEAEEEEGDHCQCPKSLIALPPLRLSEAVNHSSTASTSHCYKCAGPSTSTASLTLCSAHANESTENIDEIVQDHDTFGTDENEEDSMDSLTMALMESRSAASNMASNSSYMSSLSANKIGGYKRKSGEEMLDHHCCGKDNFQNPMSNSLNNEISPLILQSKRKREAFSEQEQEVCLTPGLFASPESSLLNENQLSPMNINAVPSVESIATVAQEPPKDLDPWLDSFSSWSHAQRLCAIDLLIGRCHPTQVRHMMAVIEPQFQRDFISLLPKELALYVLSFLHPRDLLRAAQTCRYWRILAEDNLLWREKCREAGLDDMSSDLMAFRKARRLNPAASPASTSTASPPAFVSNLSTYSPWKAGYMRQHNIEINWRVKGIRTPKVLKGHDDHVITCLQFSNNRIVSGSDDNTLKVWNATTGKCLRTLAGHTGGVWSSQMQGNVIVSGSTDRTLKVWNADSGSCLHTLHGHTSTVRCMHLHGQSVVSGSRDATLRMWDINTGECLHVLMGHVAAVRCVQYDGRLVVSGAYDYMVKVWNPETEECLHTLSGHTNRVYSLQFDGIHVVSGSLDTSIRVWDVETGACKHALMGHQSLTSGMELRNNILVSGNADSTVKVWDITTGQCLQTLSGPNKHNSAVTCLQFNSKFVITSSDDGTVKLWDVKTGEFIRDLVALESGGSGGVVWRIRANATKLVCAVGSRNGTEETKLLVLDFDVSDSNK